MFFLKYKGFVNLALGRIRKLNCEGSYTASYHKLGAARGAVAQCSQTRTRQPLAREADENGKEDIALWLCAEAASLQPMS